MAALLAAGDEVTFADFLSSEQALKVMSAAAANMVRGVFIYVLLKYMALPRQAQLRHFCYNRQATKKVPQKQKPAYKRLVSLDRKLLAPAITLWALSGYMQKNQYNTGNSCPCGCCLGTPAIPSKTD